MATRTERAEKTQAIGKALLLLQEIRDALARGTKHYSVRGEFLPDERAIIEALARDGRVEFMPRLPHVG